MAFSKDGGRGLFQVLQRTSRPLTRIGRHRCFIRPSRGTDDPEISQVESWSLGQGYDGIDIHRFKADIFGPEKPLHMKAGPESLPAIDKWFDYEPSLKDSDLRLENFKAMTPYLESFSPALTLPFELAYPQSSHLSSDTIHDFLQYLELDKAPDPALELREVIQFEQAHHDSESRTQRQDRVLRFNAPLALLQAAHNFNLERPEIGLRSLYVAQAPIIDLPRELQDDLPAPKIVKLVGRGDIYSSSIWLGLEPTFTPLHRDPNPNLFIQMCSHKSIRLLPPSSGDQLYRQVQSYLPQYLAGRASSRLRGLEMMHGPERDLLHRAVWDKNGLRGVPGAESVAATSLDSSRRMMQEAHLGPGDALFIPKGWWHSVKSTHSNGALNASVNWWFR